MNIALSEAVSAYTAKQSQSTEVYLVYSQQTLVGHNS